MNADAIRHFYDYHFSENRALWDTHILSLTHDQFMQPAAYSVGSVRNQLVHLMEVDAAWFGDLQGTDILGSLDPAALDDRAILRAHWDSVEQSMRGYLATLTDDMLLEKPFPPGEDHNLVLWQVLLHVVNHGTDHRAQILRLLYDMGLKTSAQDYIFYVYDHP